MENRYPREQLLKLYELWRHQYAVDGTTPMFQIEEESVVLLQRPIFQAAGNGIYLVGSGRNISAFRSFGDRQWSDGGLLVAYAIPSGTYSYTTVLGANRTVQKWREFALVPYEDNGLSTEDFTSLLRSGNQFVIWEHIQRQCHLCNGRTYLRGQAQFNENPNEKYPCPHCITGIENTLKRWVVRW